MKKFLLAIMFLVSTQGHAQQWTGDFKITTLYVAGPQNFHYRVYGMQTMSMCPNASAWAYVNENDPGSRGFIAAFLSAYHTGKSVRLLVQPVNGFCQILEAVVSG